MTGTQLVEMTLYVVPGARVVHATEACARRGGTVTVETGLMARERLARGYARPCGHCGKHIRAKVGLES